MRQTKLTIIIMMLIMVNTTIAYTYTDFELEIQGINIENGNIKLYYNYKTIDYKNSNTTNITYETINTTLSYTIEDVIECRKQGNSITTCKNEVKTYFINSLITTLKKEKIQIETYLLKQQLKEEAETQNYIITKQEVTNRLTE